MTRYRRQQMQARRRHYVTSASDGYQSLNMHICFSGQQAVEERRGFPWIRVLVVVAIVTLMAWRYLK